MGRLKKRQQDDDDDDDDGGGNEKQQQQQRDKKAAVPLGKNKRLRKQVSDESSSGSDGEQDEEEEEEGRAAAVGKDRDDNDDIDDDFKAWTPRGRSLFPRNPQRRLDELWPTWTTAALNDRHPPPTKSNRRVRYKDEDSDPDDDLDGFIVKEDNDEREETDKRSRSKSKSNERALSQSTSQASQDSLPPMADLLHASPERLQRLIQRTPPSSQKSSSATKYSSPLKHAQSQLSERFSLTANNTSEDAFEVYIQMLASAGCDASFIDNVLEDKDDYFMPAIERIDRDLSIIKGVCDSSAWRPHFRDALEERPYLSESTSGGSHGSDCEACNRSNHTATIALRLHGPSYNPVTFQAEEGTEDEHTVFYVGRHCAKKAGYFHWLQHCRLQMYQTVGHEVLALQKEGMSDDKVVENIINNETWIKRLYGDFEDQKSRIVEFLHNN